MLLHPQGRVVQHITIDVFNVQTTRPYEVLQALRCVLHGKVYALRGVLLRYSGKMTPFPK